MSAPAVTEDRHVWASARNALAERMTNEAADDPMRRRLVRLRPLDVEVWKRTWEFDDGSPALVVDQDTGTVIRLFRESCGSGCRCAAGIAVYEADQQMLLVLQGRRS